MNNRKISFSLGLVITLQLFSGCGDTISEMVKEDKVYPSLEPHYLQVNPRDFTFQNFEDTENGNIISFDSWKFTGLPAWLSASPASGIESGEFSLTSKANPSIYAREAVFYVESGGVKKTLTASQTGATPYVEFEDVNKNKVEISGAGGELFIFVKTNMEDLTASSSQAWCKVEYEADLNGISLQVEPSIYSRTATITLSSTSQTATAKLTLDQDASGLSIDGASKLDFDEEGGKQTVNFQSDYAWEAKPSESWIEVNPSTGKAGWNSITVTALPHYSGGSRYGYINFYFDNVELVPYITVNQKGRFLTISPLYPNYIDFNYLGTTDTDITIESNIGWEVSSSPEWVHLNPMSGEGGTTTIKLTADENTSLSSRTGTVYIKDTQTGAFERRVNVRQAGIDFEEMNALEFGWQGGNQPITVPIPNQWSAAVSDGWISLSSYTGSGQKELTVAVTRNDLENERKGKISFTSDGSTIEVNVIQQGQYIHIDSSTGEIGAMGGTVQIYMEASSETKYSVDYATNTKDWVSVVKNNNGYMIEVEENPSVNSREAILTINFNLSDSYDYQPQGIKYYLTQYGRDITVELSVIEMFYKGGTSPNVNVIADGEYSIEKGESDYWYTIVNEPQIHSFYIVCTENNSGELREGTITISLLNLPDGEECQKRIKVSQYDYNFTIDVEDYGDDEIIY